MSARSPPAAFRRHRKRRCAPPPNIWRAKSSNPSGYRAGVERFRMGRRARGLRDAGNRRAAREPTAMARPATLGGFPHEQRDHMPRALRARRAILERLDAAMRAAPASPASPLKGSALRALGIHGPASGPWATSICWFHRATSAAARAMLAAIGYAPSSRRSVTTVFAPCRASRPHPFAEHARQAVQDRAAHTHRREPARPLQVDITHQLWPATASWHQWLCDSRRTDAPPAAAHGRQHARECTALHPARRHRSASRRRLAARLARIAGLTREPRRAWWMYPPLAYGALSAWKHPAGGARRARAICPSAAAGAQPTTSTR